jgi:hypothetical protein
MQLSRQSVALRGGECSRESVDGEDKLMSVAPNVEFAVVLHAIRRSGLADRMEFMRKTAIFPIQVLPILTIRSYRKAVTALAATHGKPQFWIIG